MDIKKIVESTASDIVGKAFATFVNAIIDDPDDKGALHRFRVAITEVELALKVVAQEFGFKESDDGK